MIVVNPPFILEDELKILLPALADVLADNGLGGHRIDWIRGEG
jgi:23S rRNA (adenine2030-N6)-methyltransferase